MKKIFTLALAAAATLGAAAISPVANFSKFEANKTFTLSATPMTATVAAQGSVITRAGEPEVAGTYVGLASNETAFEAFTAPTLTKKSGNVYTVSNFLDNTTTFDLTLQEEEDGDGVTFWALRIAPETVVANLEGNDYILALCDGQSIYFNDNEDNNGFLFAGVNTETEDGKPELFFPYNGLSIFVGYSTGGNNYRGGMFNVKFYLPSNGEMVNEEYEGDGETTYKSTYPVYAIEDTENDAIVIYNVGGFPLPMGFLLDGNQAIAEMQVLMNHQTAGECIASGVVDDQLTGTVTADYKKEGNVVTLTIPEEWYITSSQGWLAKYGSTVFTLFGGSEDGINDVAADNVNNANAPVEYFNLQGIRVNTPAAGQLVIRRQGTEVSKILVK